MRSGRDVLEDLGELVDQPHERGLAGVEARNQAAQIDSGGEAESGCDVLGQLLGGEGAVGIEGDLDGGIAHLSVANLLAKAGHMLAESEVVHAGLLERLEACDF